MRIICLILVRVILLSTSIAETDRPIGLDPYHYRYQPKPPRPIILKPVMKFKSEGPLDWLINAMSRVIDRQKKPPPITIGPIDLPRTASQVYIRQLEDYSPEGSNRVIIKVVTHEPMAEMNMPYDSNIFYNYLEDSARRIPKSHSYDANKSSGRLLNAIQQSYQAPIAKKYYNEQPYYGVQNHHYSNFNTKPFGVSDSNNPNHRHYHFRNHRKPYDSNFVPPRSYYNAHDGKFQSTSITPITPTIPIPYSHYTGPVNDENTDKPVNTTWTDHLASSTRLPLESSGYESVVRNDRMVSNYPHRESFTPRYRTNFHDSEQPRNFRKMNRVPTIKFELDDVRGGLEIITPPNTITWRQESSDHDGTSKNFGIHGNAVSIDTDHGTNVAGNTSVEHTNEKQIEDRSATILQSRLSAYTVIDRAHRHRAGQNRSSESPRAYFDRVDHTDQKNTSLTNSVASADQKVECDEKTNNATSDVANKPTTELREGNRWRFQEGRKPTKIVKAIYQRKPPSDDPRAIAK